MKNRKDLDQLYREHLRNAEVKPPMNAWSNIAARLPEKEKKNTVLPLWYKIAGAAAVLLLFVTVSYIYFSPASIYTDTPISSKPETIEQISNEKEQTKPQPFPSTSPEKQIADQIEPAANVAKTNDPSNTSGKIHLEGSKRTEENTEVNPAILYQIAFENPKAASPLATKESTAVELQTETQTGSGKEEEVALAPDPETPMESQLAQEEPVEAPSEKSFGRLSISTKAAPVFFDQTGGNGTHGIPGTGSGEGSISYGVQLAYQVTKKFSVRSGLQVLNLNSSNQEFPMKASAPMETPVTGAALVLSSADLGEMELRKDLDFFEVPLEMEYTLIDDTFKLNLIGGGSLLLLNKSDLSMNSSFGVRALPETENPDPLSFTTNLGIGLGYELFQQFELNLEPMMKFPLNPGPSMSPYYFGIYSGFSYQF